MSTYKEKEALLSKARELYAKIEAVDDTVRYRELALKIRNDRDAQNLLAALIEMGKNIEQSLESKDDAYRKSAEYDLLNKAFEKNADVKEFLSMQKRYLNLLTVVKNAISEGINGEQES